jgi:Restriction endonuclease NaeI
MRGKSGNERVETLFREVQDLPVHRDIVQAVGQQKDPMKRIRKNGGARDALAREGIAFLSGKFDRALITRLGLERTGTDESISFKPTSADDIAMLRKAGKIA